MPNNFSKMNQLQDFDLKNKKVFIRADLNVPIKSGKITSSQRIESSLATINYCLKAGAKVMVTSHLGRPKEGEYNPEFSLEPVVEFLENHLNKKINLIKDWTAQPFDVDAGEIVVLENCRFNVGESGNNENLAKKICRSHRHFRDGCLWDCSQETGLHIRNCPILSKSLCWTTFL